jgi:anti-sigma regulatory factor (Ser/Thr protein kinase)
MAEVPNVRLKLSNAPESVSVVHQALAGVCEILGLDPLETNDLDTAVTEVCKNVVLHAYEGQEGSLQVEVYALPAAVEVVVRDRGIGIRPHVGERTQPHTGLGLPIVHALTQRLGFRKLGGGGTEVRMQFAVPQALALEALTEDRSGSQIAGEGALASPSAIEIALAPSAVARAVLPRVLGELAQRACFCGERVADVQLLAGSLAAIGLDSLAAGHLCVAVELAPRSLELRTGPLRPGSAARLLDSGSDGLGAAIERLASDHRVAPFDSAEMLELSLLERS